jgi:hypothetical protein
MILAPSEHCEAAKTTKSLYSEWIFTYLERFFHDEAAIAIFAIWDASS